MKTVKAVAALIVNSKGEMLCAQRSESKYAYVSFKWEFPGGKIEEGETEQEALMRELREELELEVDVKNKYFEVEHSYPDFHLSMPVYVCVPKTKELHLMVHKNVVWLSQSQMLSLDWAPADIPVAEKIYNFGVTV